MSTVLFPVYSNFGVRLFLGLQGPEGMGTSRSLSTPAAPEATPKPEPTPTPTERVTVTVTMTPTPTQTPTKTPEQPQTATATPLSGYWGEQYRAGIAAERYSLEKLANKIKFWLQTCQGKRAEVTYHEASSLRDAVKALKADPGSQEHADLINRAEQELAFARPQAAINGVESWLNTCQKSTEIHYGNFATLLDALVDFRQRGTELLNFLRNTSAITEDHEARARAQLILTKAQNVLEQLQGFLKKLEKEKEAFIQLSPYLQSIIDKLPGLVKDVEKIVEEMEALLGDTPEGTDLPQKSQP